MLCKYIVFLSEMSLRRTSRDLNSCPPPLHPFDKNQNLDKKNQVLPYSNNFNNVDKYFLPKNSSKENSSKNISQKIQKISKQLLKKFPIFRKCPIPYIALGGRKPFWACFVSDLTFKNNLGIVHNMF